MQSAATVGPRERGTSSCFQTKLEPLNISLSVQGRCKKRHLSDQIANPSKRTKLEEDDLRERSVVEFEDFAIIAKKEEGIKSVSLMDRLFYIMLEDRNGSVTKLVDRMMHRTLLASIIVATEEEEYLTRFVQLGGLRVLNNWLQEAHKGKPANGSPEDVQTVLEGLLLMLIRALSKLPVDFDALKSSIVGKSVNKLRSHENLEVQKMARKLVDTWKRRVNAEIRSLDEGRTNTCPVSPSTVAREAQSTNSGSAKRSILVRPVANRSDHSGDSKIIRQTMIGCKEHLALSLSRKSPRKPVIDAASSTIAIKKEKDVLCSVKLENDMLSVVNKEKYVRPMVMDETRYSSNESQNSSQVCYSGFMKGDEWRKEELKVIAPVGHKLGTKVHGPIKCQVTRPTVVSLQKDLMEKCKDEKSFSDKGTAEGARAEHNPRLIVRLPNPGRTSSFPVSRARLSDESAAATRRPLPSSLRHDYGSNTIRANPGQSSRMTRDNRQKHSCFKEESSTSCLKSLEDKGSKSVVLEHRSKVCDGILVQAIGQKKKRGSSKKSLTPAFDGANQGIDLLASVATCEVTEAERIFGRSNDVDGHSLSADALINSPMQGQVNSNHQQGDVKNAEEGICEKVSSSNQEHGLSDSFMTSPVNPVEHKGSGDRISAVKEQNSFSLARTEVTFTTVPDFGAVICDKMKHVKINSIGRCQEESTSMGNSISNLSMSKILTAPKSSSIIVNDSCKDNEIVQEGCVPLLAITKGVDALRFSEEDPREAARHKAKEEVQEVEKNKSEVPDDKSVSLIVESSMCKDALGRSNKITSGNEVYAHIDASQVSRHAGELAKSDETMVKGPHLPCRIAQTDERSVRDGDEETMQQCIDGANESLPVPKDASVSVMAEAEEGANAYIKLKFSGSNDGFCESKDVEQSIFDLNEGLNVEMHDSIAAHLTNASPKPGVPCLESPSGVATQANPLTVPVAVLAATKGAFIPRSNPVQAKGDLRWKGSAATSAFRPAEPRCVAETPQPLCDAIASACASEVATVNSGKQPRILDIDLNIADGRLLDDYCTIARLSNIGSSESLINQEFVATSLDLDLNRKVENDEMSPTITTSRGTMTSRAPTSSVPDLAASRIVLEIDLNDGLCNGEEIMSQPRVLESSQSIFTGITRHDVNTANVPLWNLTRCSMPTTMVTPTIPSSRSESLYPIVSLPGSNAVITRGNIAQPFSNDVYQGMAVSSCGLLYSGSTTPTSFSYAGCLFGSSFPVTSAAHSIVSSLGSSASSAPLLMATSSQMVSTGAVFPSYGRPYPMGNAGDIPGFESRAAWIKPTLDLNTGPEFCAEFDNRESISHSVGLNQFQQIVSVVGNIKGRAPESSFDRTKQATWR